MNSQESPGVEKLDEMPDYETTNGVVAGSTRISPNGYESITHPDSLLIQGVKNDRNKK